MQYRRFGRTDLQVPAVTFGGGWVGGVLIHGTEDAANAALDRAWAAGINWVDTAALYGNGVSETVIGRWLGGRPATDLPRLSTKFRIDPAAGDPAGQMRASVEASLSRLDRDHVDVLILHNQIGPEFGFSPSDALAIADAMSRLVEEGICDHIGMTALGDPGALAQTVDAGRFDVAQVYYNALNPTALQGRTPWNSTNFDGLLHRCQAQDMGVMGIRIFAAGHLATDIRHGREIPITEGSDDAAEERRAKALWQVLTPDDGTPAQAALRFGLACDALSTIVVGLGELDHLDQVIAAEAAGPMADDRIAAIAAVWKTAAFTA